MVSRANPAKARGFGFLRADELNLAERGSSWCER